MKKLCILIIIALTLLSGCTPQRSAEHSFFALDTVISLKCSPSSAKEIETLVKEYEKLLTLPEECFPEGFRLRHFVKEEGVPYAFIRLEDERTTCVEARRSGSGYVGGVYIDIFPIDYVPERSKLSQKLFHLKLKLLKFRVRSVWNLPKNSFAKELVSLVAKVYCPKVRTAVRRIDKMLISDKESNLVRVSGGKPKEQGIPKSWFETTEKGVFEGVEVWIPEGYSEYLTKIYGDYENRTLLENKEVNEEGVEINACIVDVSRPYTEYVKF